MKHTCAKCGESGHQLWMPTRIGEGIPSVWICVACRKEWLK